MNKTLSNLAHQCVKVLISKGFDVNFNKFHYENAILYIYDSDNKLGYIRFMPHHVVVSFLSSDLAGYTADYENPDDFDLDKFTMDYKFISELYKNVSDSEILRKMEYLSSIYTIIPGALKDFYEAINDNLLKIYENKQRRMKELANKDRENWIEVEDIGAIEIDWSTILANES